MQQLATKDVKLPHRGHPQGANAGAMDIRTEAAWHLPRRRSMMAACLCIALSPLLAGATPASAANQIGVTAAVRPDVRGTPPDQESRILAVGTDIFAEEQVVTSKRGQTHLLFVDGSTLSMGPGAELVLDRFVYDADRKVGELVVTASKGLLRFVGGRISKKRPVLIKTPTAVIGIRGGIALIQVGDTDTPASVTMLYGQEAFMERNGRRQTITRPGYRIVEAQDGGIEEPKQATQAELTQELQTLEDPPPVEELPAAEEEQSLGEIAPAAGGNAVRDEDVAATQMAELGSDNDPPAEITVSGPESSTETTSSQATVESTMAQQQVATVAQKPVSATLDADPSENRIEESSADFTATGITAKASDLNAADTIAFSLTENAGGRFAIDPQTGVIRVANSALLDAETSQSHSVTVQATSSDGSFTTATFTIIIEDDNSEFAASMPADSDATANQVSETTANGSTVGVTAISNDADISDSVTYSLDNNAGGRFTIDPQTGIIAVANDALLDAETSQNHSVTVKATSSDGSFTTTTFIIIIEDDNSEFAASTPVDSNTAANLVNESAVNDSAVGVTANGPDNDVSDAVTYSLDDSAGGRFAIDPTTGTIRVADSALLDAETTLNHSVTVRTTSADGSSSSATFTIAISDDRTEHSVSTPTINSGVVAHGAADGVVTNATASATDADISDSDGITFSLIDDAGGRFRIGADTGNVIVSTIATDFKSARRHTLTVRATSPDGSTADGDYTIPVRYEDYEGRLKRDANSSIDGTDDADQDNNFALSLVVMVRSLFVAAPLPPGAAGLTIFLPFPDAAGPFTFDIGDGSSAGVSLYGTGNGFLNSPQTFVYYEVTDAVSARSLVFAGDPTTGYPSTGITGFDLTRDFVRDQDLPFIGGFPNTGQTQHGRVHVAWDDSAPSAQRAVGGGIVYVTGTGTSQQSGAFFITGQVLDDPSATRHVSASLFGQSRTASGAQPTFYSGGLASSDTDTQSDFFGDAPDAFVLESATVNGSDVVQSIGLESSVSGTTASYNANSVALHDESAMFTAGRSAQTLNGFAISRQLVVNGAVTVTNGIAFAKDNDPVNISIATDPSLNTVNASFTLGDINGRTIVYNFGSASADGTGAFIEDGRFFAQGSSTTVNGSPVTSVQGLATSDIAVFDSSTIPASFDLCNCDYLQWGFWGAKRDFFSGSPNTAISHLATWVAGDLATDAQVTSSNVAGAVYSGNVMGDIQNGSDRYMASGSIQLIFDFSPGLFNLKDVTVNDFDGATYTSTGAGGGQFTSNMFSSADAGLTIASPSRTMTLHGAFFAGRAAPAPPLATAGQATVLGDLNNYKATLTFGAALQP